MVVGGAVQMFKSKCWHLSVRIQQYPLRRSDRLSKDSVALFERWLGIICSGLFEAVLGRCVSFALEPVVSLYSFLFNAWLFPSALWPFISDISVWCHCCFLDRVSLLSDGSFLWAPLTCCNAWTRSSNVNCFPPMAPWRIELIFGVVFCSSCFGGAWSLVSSALGEWTCLFFLNFDFFPSPLWSVPDFPSVCLFRFPF